MTCIEKSIVTKSDDGEHAGVGSGPTRMRRRLFVPPDESSAQDEAKDAQQNVGAGEQTREETVEVVESKEEHCLPTGVLPEHVDSNR